MDSEEFCQLQADYLNPCFQNVKLCSKGKLFSKNLLSKFPQIFYPLKEGSFHRPRSLCAYRNLKVKKKKKKVKTSAWSPKEVFKDIFLQLVSFGKFRNSFSYPNSSNNLKIGGPVVRNPPANTEM